MAPVARVMMALSPPTKAWRGGRANGSGGMGMSQVEEGKSDGVGVAKMASMVAGGVVAEGASVAGMEIWRDCVSNEMDGRSAAAPGAWFPITIGIAGGHGEVQRRLVLDASVFASLEVFFFFSRFAPSNLLFTPSFKSFYSFWFAVRCYRLCFYVLLILFIFMLHEDEYQIHLFSYPGRCQKDS